MTPSHGTPAESSLSEAGNCRGAGASQAPRPFPPVFQFASHVLTPAVEAALGAAMERLAAAECEAMRKHGRKDVPHQDRKQPPGTYGTREAYLAARHAATDAQNDAIREMLREGKTQGEIGRALGLTSKRVSYRVCKMRERGEL